MTVSEAIGNIHAPKGVTTLIAAINTGNLAPIKDQNALGASLETARTRLADVKRAQDECQSDWAYWGFQGDIAYWSAAVDILEAASLVGADNLPDVAVPTLEGRAQMDACAAVEQYGRKILAAARALAPKGVK